MRGESSAISRDRIDMSDAADRRSITDISATRSNLSIKKRAERRRQRQRAALVREHMQSMNPAPSRLQALLARLFK